MFKDKPRTLKTVVGNGVQESKPSLVAEGSGVQESTKIETRGEALAQRMDGVNVGLEAGYTRTLGHTEYGGKRSS